jgi:hypothetical protein
MHNPRKIVKVSPVLFTSVSQTFDEFCRQKCFTSPCLAKNKQVMATQSKLGRIKLFLRHLPNCPCSYFSPYVDLFQEISPRIAKQLRF